MGAGVGGLRPRSQSHVRRKKPRLSVGTGDIEGAAERETALAACLGAAPGAGAPGFGVGTWGLLTDGAEWDRPPEERIRTLASAHGTSIAIMATTASVPMARCRTLKPFLGPTGTPPFFLCPRVLSETFGGVPEDAHMPTSRQPLSTQQGRDHRDAMCAVRGGRTLPCGQATDFPGQCRRGRPISHRRCREMRSLNLVNHGGS